MTGPVGMADRNADERVGKIAGAIMAIQGSYYLASGLWPIVHIGSFMAITGPKEDVWLVKTFGMMTLCIGLGLLTAVFDKQLSRPMVVTAMSVAAGLIIADVYYVLSGVLWWTYLLDALGEGVLLVGWIWVISRSGKL